jgi:U3 small nucleolar RNA-associated protein 6
VQDFEYALQRRMVEKADFLRSIEYEKSLERLRVLRKKERNITASRKKTTLTEYCIIRRTHKLYERMLRKFKGDLALWNDWIQFCAACRSSKQMSKVLTRTMQLFPTHAAVWTYAAAWELERHNNATVARSLMQTGIRMCKNDAMLWVEYFRMELLYAARLLERRRVLFADEDAAGGGVGGGNGGGDRDGDRGGDRGGEMGLDEATRALLSGGVAKVVYVNAMERVDTYAVALDFLRVLRPLPIMDRDDLEDFIIDDALERCRGQSMPDEARATLISGIAHHVFSRARDNGSTFLDAAMLAVRAFEDFQGTTLLYEGKVGVLEDMFAAAVMEDDEEDNKEDNEEATLLFLLHECLNTAEEARVNSCTSTRVEMAARRANMRLGQYRAACPAGPEPDNRDIVSMPADQDDHAHVEQIHMSAFTHAISPKEEEMCSSLESFQSLPRDARSPPAWCAMLATSAPDLDRLAALGDLFARDQLECATSAYDSERGTVASCLANCLWLNAGIPSARAFYQRVLKGPLPGASFITGVARMERALLNHKNASNADLDRIRRIYDVGADVYGAASVDLWLEYYRFELQLDTRVSKADAVYWKATKTAEDAAYFVAHANGSTASPM